MRNLMFIIAIFLLCFCLVSCKSIKEESENFIDDNGIEKIGVISVWSDLEDHQYVYKDEVFVTDEQIIEDIVSIINQGEIDDTIALDRLPAEYEIQIYYDNEIVKCYYWLNEIEYNFNISAISGEITVDSKAMDEMMLNITGETGREKIDNPY